MWNPYFYFRISKYDDIILYVSGILSNPYCTHFRLSLNITSLILWSLFIYSFHFIFYCKMSKRLSSNFGMLLKYWQILAKVNNLALKCITTYPDKAPNVYGASNTPQRFFPGWEHFSKTIFYTFLLDSVRVQSDLFVIVKLHGIETWVVGMH